MLQGKRGKEKSPKSMVFELLICLSKLIMTLADVLSVVFLAEHIDNFTYSLQGFANETISGFEHLSNTQRRKMT